MQLSAARAWSLMYGVGRAREAGPAWALALQLAAQLGDRFLLRRDAAAIQRTHVLLHLAQFQPQVPCRMETGEVVAREAFHAAHQQRQGVARRQHRRRAAAGRQT